LRGARRRLMVLLALAAVPATAQATPSSWSTASTEEPPPHVSLNIVLAGSGEGAVYDKPDGIDCGLLCSISVTAGWRVYLEGVPFQGDTFVGWSGASCSGTSVCVLEPQADTSVTATFEPEPAPAAPDCQSTSSVERDPTPPRPQPRKSPRRIQRLKCGRGTRKQELANGAAECVSIEGARHRG
jgi:Divergent InlB B-repeat domain